MSRRGVPLLATALLLGVSAGAAAPEGDPSLGCGNLAPFVLSCQECCGVLGTAPEAVANLLGFAGELEMRLDGAAGAWVWQCWTVLVDKPLPRLVGTCTGPEAEGVPPVAGEQVSLRCTAGPHDTAGVPVGPAGPWGCRSWP